MTDQTRWGIPEVQLKNKVKKYQDDNFNAALNHAKNLNGKRINNGQSLLNYGQYTFPGDAISIYVYFISPGNCDMGEIYSAIGINTSQLAYTFVSDTLNTVTSVCSFLTYQSGVFIPTVPGGYLMIFPYRSGLTEEDMKNLFPQLRGYT